ncbi:MAG: cupin domain-containing protein [Actinomycetota bacterium]|nr:cupin domain-containing protein [Actinomycetota bacterium]
MGGALAPGEGEIVTDRPGRTLRILAELDQLIVTWFRYEPGEVGPDPHVHHRHSDAFYVLEGELELSLGPELKTVNAVPGTLAAAPPDVVHTFRNASDATAIFLNVHAPSMGFGDHIRGRGESFDQHEPPADGGLPFADAVLSAPGAGERIEGRSTTIVKAGADDCDGQLSVYETALPASNTGPPLHLHRRTAEAFFVLNGSFLFTAGDQQAVLEAGAFALVPPGPIHTFANHGDAEARCLTIAGPAGVEAFIREAVRADPAALAELGARHDTFLQGG